MVNNINLTNFQKHDNLSIDFIDGLNIIVGQSDVGKSAIIRALKWVVFNRPLGDGFKKFETDFVKVNVTIDNTILERFKDKKDNYYKLNEQYFRAFGNEVPEAVSKFLNVNEVNFQFQFDSPFLVSLTPSQINEYINNLVDLELINRCMETVSKELRKVSGDIKSTEYNIKQLKEKYKKYSYLPEYYRRYSLLDKEYKEVEDEISNCNKIIDLLDRYNNINKEVEKYKQVDVILEGIDKVEVEYNKLVEGKKQVDFTLQLMETYKDKMEKLHICNLELEDTEKMLDRLIKELGGICPICGNVLSKEFCCD